MQAHKVGMETNICWAFYHKPNHLLDALVTFKIFILKTALWGMYYWSHFTGSDTADTRSYVYHLTNQDSNSGLPPTWMTFPQHSVACLNTRRRENRGLSLRLEQRWLCTWGLGPLFCHQLKETSSSHYMFLCLCSPVKNREAAKLPNLDLNPVHTLKCYIKCCFYKLDKSSALLPISTCI